MADDTQDDGVGTMEEESQDIGPCTPEASDDSSWGSVFAKDGATYIKVDISEIRPRDNDEVEIPKEAKLLSTPKSTAKLIDVTPKEAKLLSNPKSTAKLIDDVTPKEAKLLSNP